MTVLGRCVPFLALTLEMQKIHRVVNFRIMFTMRSAAERRTGITMQSIHKARSAAVVTAFFVGLVLVAMGKLMPPPPPVGDTSEH